MKKQTIQKTEQTVEQTNTKVKQSIADQKRNDGGYLWVV